MSFGAVGMVVVVVNVVGLVVDVDVVAAMDIVAGRNLNFRTVDHGYN